jgi:hypothetical protein
MIFYHCDTHGDFSADETWSEYGRHYCVYCEMPVSPRDTASLIAERDALRAALAPFVSAYGGDAIAAFRSSPDHLVIRSHSTLGMIRPARAALEKGT